MKYVLVIILALNLICIAAALKGSRMYRETATAGETALSADGAADTVSSFRLLAQLNSASAILAAICFVASLLIGRRRRRAGETHSAHVIQAAQRFHGG